LMHGSIFALSMDAVSWTLGRKQRWSALALFLLVSAGPSADAIGQDGHPIHPDADWTHPSQIENADNLLDLYPSEPPHDSLPADPGDYLYELEGSLADWKE